MPKSRRLESGANLLDRPPSVDTMRWYLQAIGKTPLLSPAEEVELSQAIQSMIQLRDKKEILAEKFGREPSIEEWAKFVGIDKRILLNRKRTGEQAKSKMLKANLRLVVTIAKKYNHRGLELLDLIQEGALGLERAAEKFDPAKGYKFSTYAYWWIRQAITRAIAQQGRTIRIPVHITEALNQLKKVQRQAAQLRNNEPMHRRVAGVYLGLEAKSIRNTEIAAICRDFHQGKRDRESALMSIIAAVGRLKERAQGMMSLSSKTGEKNDLELEQMVASDVDLDQNLEQSLLREAVEKAISRLNPRSQEVIRMRFGLEDGVARSLKEIGNSLDLSCERVRQIEAKALRHLKTKLLNLKATV